MRQTMAEALIEFLAGTFACSTIIAAVWQPRHVLALGLAACAFALLHIADEIRKAA